MKTFSTKNLVPLLLFGIILLLSFFILRPFLLAIFLGGLLAYMSYPLYRFLSGKLKKKKIAAFLVCLLIFLVFVVPSIFLLKVLVQESYALFILVKQKLAVGLFTNCQAAFCETVRSITQEPEFYYQIQEVARTVTNWIIQKGSALLLSLPKLVLNLVVLFFVLFYSLIDGEAFLKKLNVYLGLQQQKYDLILRRMEEITKGVTYGYVLVALMQGALGALGFYLFGVSSPLFWGMIMTFLALIPVLGTGLVWVPASVILFLDGLFQDSTGLMIKGIGLFIYSFLFVSCLDNIVRPKLIGDKAKVHLSIILLGIFGGILAFGPLGVLVGPIILSLLTVVLKVYFENENKSEHQ